MREMDHLVLLACSLPRTHCNRLTLEAKMSLFPNAMATGKLHLGLPKRSSAVKG